MTLALRAGNNVRRIRTLRNLTQHELSAKSHVGVETIRRIERGENISLLTLERVASALNTQPWTLLT